MFAAMASRYRAGEADAVDPVVVEWDIAALDGVRSYQMTLAEGACIVTGGVAARPRVMFGIEPADLQLLADGAVGWMDLFMAGRLRLSGDLALARALEAQFSRDGHPAEGHDHGPR